MKAIIPIAGKGTRLLPHSAFVHKSLLPVAGKAILDRIIDPLALAGINEICLVLGHMGDQVKAHMRKYRDLKVSYVYQYQQKGLGHAVLQGLEAIDDPVLIVLSDTIFELDYQAFINEGASVVGVVEVDNPQAFGIVETVGRKIVDMVEKPEQPMSNLAIAGIYRIENQGKLKTALERLIESDRKTKGEYQLTDALRDMIERGAPFRTQELTNWLDCGTPETLLATNRHLLAKENGQYVDSTATIEGSTIRSSAIMKGCTVIDTIIDNSIILAGVKLEKCYIHDEIIKSGTTLTGYSTGS